MTPACCLYVYPSESVYMSVALSVCVPLPKFRVYKMTLLSVSFFMQYMLYQRIVDD
jgi:hypothetical protein